jgi:hypothetical protein
LITFAFFRAPFISNHANTNGIENANVVGLTAPVTPPCGVVVVLVVNNYIYYLHKPITVM